MRDRGTERQRGRWRDREFMTQINRLQDSDAKRTDTETKKQIINTEKSTF